MDVFHQPGMCDLTANVDFAYLKEAISTAGENTDTIQLHFILTLAQRCYKSWNNHAKGLSHWHGRIRATTKTPGWDARWRKTCTLGKGGTKVDGSIRNGYTIQSTGDNI